MPYILGIDHGNTKTAAAVMDDTGRILAHARILNQDVPNPTGESNYLPARIMVICQYAYGRALRDAGLAITDIDVVCGGLTGADWPEEYDILRDGLREVTGVSKTWVYNDCSTAFYGAARVRCGAVVCMGTGLNVGVFSPDGEIYAYGWYIDGDCAGAGALGNRAIRKVVQAAAGVIPPTALTEKILGAFGYKTVEEFMRKNLAGQLPQRPNALAPLVLDAAEEGDAAAIEIAADVAAKAAQYAVAGLERYGMADMDVDIVLTGSVYKHRHGLMRDTSAQVIRAIFPRAVFRDAEYEPVVGAAILGLERAHGEISEQGWARIHESCVKLGLMREIG